MKARENQKKLPNSFIRKTFKILNQSRNSDVVAWNEDGLSFVIKDQHLFTTVILPQYFRHSNFASFNRQLNMYDFHKTREDALEFSHPLFQRNNESLLIGIKRKTAEPYKLKETTHELGQRLVRFQKQQNTMENMLESLEQQYDKIMEQNQVLICELMQSKQREKSIEMYLAKFEEKKKGKEKEKESRIADEKVESEDFVKLSPLSSKE
jgi:hypothetical protein